jgi:hypothetical protein
MALIRYGGNNFYTNSVGDCRTVDRLEDKIREMFKIKDQRFEVTIPLFRQIFYPETGTIYLHKGAFYVEDGVLTNPTGGTTLPWFTYHETPVKINFVKERPTHRVGFKTITGYCVFMELLDEETIGQVKRRLGAHHHVSETAQLFSYKGRILTDDMVVRDLQFPVCATVNVMISMKGGMYHPSSGRNAWGREDRVIFSLVQETKDGELSVVEMEERFDRNLHELI